MLQQNSASSHCKQSNQLFLPALFLGKAALIEQWFIAQWEKGFPPIATSVDLRNSAFKLAPVDTNLFPAGFNNLSPDSFNFAVAAMRTILDALNLGETPSVALIVENHTRNAFYFQSVYIFTKILQDAGFIVRLTSLDPTLREPRVIILDHVETETNATAQSVHTPSSLQKVRVQPSPTSMTEQRSSLLANQVEKKLVLEPLTRRDNRLYLDNFDPTFILLNNDLSSGIPPILEGLAQPVFPDIRLGWALRLKSNHFSCFNQVASEFSEYLAIDPWYINPYFDAVDNLDFMSQQGIEHLAETSQQVLDKIQNKYLEYQILEKPFVIIKADNGTYGMSVMTVHSGEELYHLNRKKRSHMTAIKGGQKVNRVIIQEGVYTIDRATDGAIAEPVIYMIGKYVIGGFYRFHHARQVNENLNSPGMKFEALPFHARSFPPVFETAVQTDNEPCNSSHSPIFYSYSIVARLAALAAAKEISTFAGNQI